MYFLSRCYLQHLIAERDADGIATKRLTNQRQVLATALWKYDIKFELKCAPELKSWGVCVVRDDVVISPRVMDAIANDPDVIAVLTARTQALDSSKSATLNAALASTDLGIQVRDGECLNDVIGRIVKDVLGHYATFKPDEAGKVDVGTKDAATVGTSR